MFKIILICFSTNQLWAGRLADYNHCEEKRLCSWCWNVMSQRNERITKYFDHKEEKHVGFWEFFSEAEPTFSLDSLKYNAAVLRILHSKCMQRDYKIWICLVVTFWALFSKSPFSMILHFILILSYISQWYIFILISKMRNYMSFNLHFRFQNEFRTNVKLKIMHEAQYSSSLYVSQSKLIVEFFKVAAKWFLKSNSLLSFWFLRASSSVRFEEHVVKILLDSSKKHRLEWFSLDILCQIHC